MVERYTKRQFDLVSDCKMNSDVVFETREHLGIVRLNRPKALNALTLPMVRAIQKQLNQWEKNNEILSVALVGEGDKAFCAGGDVKGLYDSGLGDGVLAADFFREEYDLDYRLATFPKIVVAIIDGVTMGGGVGLSLHGRVRIATERTVFAMPETSIGLFPDVGASHFLSRLPGGIGLFLGLTGQRLKALDCLNTGVATHFLPSSKIDRLLDKLASCRQPLDLIEDLIVVEVCDQASALKDNRSCIDEIFSLLTMEEIISALQEEDSDWSRKTLTKLNTYSPTSLKITCTQLERAKSLSLAEVFKMEYRISQACMKGHDFFEGVRALLIDRDKKPKWNPEKLEKVDEALVLSHFTALDTNELILKESFSTQL